MYDGGFAHFYDLLMKDTDYDAIAARYIQLAQRCGIQSGRAADLGCGTGELSRRLAAAGYDTIGVDISEEMLSIASCKACCESSVQYIHQDMTKLDLGGEADLLVSSLDCFCHLRGGKQVMAAFARAFENLRGGGVFIFDMNTVFKHSEVLADNAFVFENEQVFCVWQNFYSGGGRVEIALDMFAYGEDGRYDRYCEDFEEYAYPLADVEKWLRQAGFEVAGVFDGLGEEAATERCERALFLAIKK